MSLDPLPPRAHHHSCACRVFEYPSPVALMIGTHKFLKRQGPGWLLVPELWNWEDSQRAQTQPLCRNAGLIRSCGLRFFPLTRSQQPLKAAPLCGCYFDQVKLQGTESLQLSFVIPTGCYRDTSEILSFVNNQHLIMKKQPCGVFFLLFSCQASNFLCWGLWGKSEEDTPMV